MGDEDKKSGFRVSDRRRFDTSGTERDDSTATDESSASPGTGEDPGAAEGPSEPGPEPEINFSSFVISLGTQALMQLGQIEAPQGAGIAVDREAAKQTIDLLTMLEEKTRGNLDSDEARLIEEVLHNLRLSFVRSR